MARSVRLYTAAQFEEVTRLVDLMAERLTCRPPNATGSPPSRWTRSRRSVKTAAVPPARPGSPCQRADPRHDSRTSRSDAANRHLPGASRPVAPRPQRRRQPPSGMRGGRRRRPRRVRTGGERYLALPKPGRALHHPHRAAPRSCPDRGRGSRRPVAPQAARRAPAWPGRGRSPRRPGRLGRRDHRRRRPPRLGAPRPAAGRVSQYPAMAICPVCDGETRASRRLQTAGRVRERPGQAD